MQTLNNACAAASVAVVATFATTTLALDGPGLEAPPTQSLAQSQSDGATRYSFTFGGQLPPPPTITAQQPVMPAKPTLSLPPGSEWLPYWSTFVSINSAYDALDRSRRPAFAAWAAAHGVRDPQGLRMMALLRQWSVGSGQIRR